MSSEKLLFLSYAVQIRSLFVFLQIEKPRSQSRLVLVFVICIADTHGCFANSSPHSKINISLEWFFLNVTRLFFFCLCHQKLHLLHEIFIYLSYQPIGGTKNNDKSNILCLADTLWAKSGSGCQAIPWTSAAGPIIPCPTSFPVLAGAWMWSSPTGGRLAPVTNTLTSSASQVSNSISHQTHFQTLFLTSTLLCLL